MAGTSGTTGAAGSTGSAGTGGSSQPTAGCGIATWPPANDQSGSTPHTLDVNSTTREFLVGLPTGYSPNQQRKLIFVWHPQGGTHRGTVSGGYHGVRSRIPEAIYVAAQGLGSGGSTGWPNTNGGDIAFTRAMLSWLQTNYCIDTTRIFSFGFSYGGIMSDTIACQMPDVFRAIAPIAGMLFSGTQSCKKLPIAALFIHGSADTINPISGNVTVRDYLLGTNNCGMTTRPAEPSPCVAYDGCDAGKPVIWCEHTGGHAIPSFSAPAISAFFQQF
jgi:poly(3-hydroxybutyrate) depolymerase